VKLVEKTLECRFLESLPEKLIGDRAYDSDPLDEKLKAKGIEMIAPHRKNRKKPATQSEEALRSYKNRWKIERLFAHLFNFRRLVIRYERKAQNFLAFLYLAAALLLLNKLNHF
jgi:transposase